MSYPLCLRHPALPGGAAELAFSAGHPPLQITIGGSTATWDGEDLHHAAARAVRADLPGAAAALRDAHDAVAVARDAATAAARAAINAGMSESEAARILGVDRSRTLRVWLGKAPR